MEAAKRSLTPSGSSSLDSELFTIEETCRKLRISRWQFYRLVNQRELTTIHIGRRHLVPAGAITTFIKKRSEEAA